MRLLNIFSSSAKENDSQTIGQLNVCYGDQIKKWWEVWTEAHTESTLAWTNDSSNLWTVISLSADV